MFAFGLCSLRAAFGTTTVKNAVYGSASDDAAQREIDLFISMLAPIQTT